MAKGNVIVGQSGGPTTVINSSLAGVFKTAKDRGAKHVYGMRNGIAGLLEGRYVDMSEHINSDLEVELLKRTPSSYLGSCRYKLPAVEGNEETYEKIFKFLKEKEIEYFFYIGGNDSMDSIAKLSDYAAKVGSSIRFMGVPKTIDNDLAVTDHSPGFGSAAKYIASITKEVIRDSRVYGNSIVTIMEMMGRNAGWLTAATTLSKDEDCDGPDLLYIPEIDFEQDKFLARIEELMKYKKDITVAISEGIKFPDGTYVCESAPSGDVVDAFGHKPLSGASGVVTSMITGNFKCKTRTIELSSLQRCAAHMASLTDINEAFLAGGTAVKAAFDGHCGEMIILKRISDDPYICVTETAGIHSIANVEKLIPREWLNERGDYVTEDYIRYARPLIQGELYPMMSNGLPRHLTLAD